jgi:hypothetical protein
VAKVTGMFADIEELVARELGGLCPSCIHNEGCAFRIRSEKVVIQCGQFESETTTVSSTPEKGLCLNCSKAAYCHLPKEPSGVWHCEEYE